MRLAEGVWTLNSPRLVLLGGVFRGVVTVESAAGPKRLLEFTARSVEVEDLDLEVRQTIGTWHLQAAPGTTSTIVGNSVTLYAEMLVGTFTTTGQGAAPPGDRVTVTPSNIPSWLFNPVAAPSDSASRTITIKNAAVSQISLTRASLTIPRAHVRMGSPSARPRG
ncbi:hypothetical protein OG373_37730 [Streptomyces avidinii]|uniref:hypothetical protein n=1 Tax=Streptomyces avidinii TaxID=1895 RepID=UPI00386E7543|nr:hypothetical protein OG373_37730 [Streptomyces avidinii]